MDGAGNVERDAEMAGEAVAAAGGDDAEGDGSSDEDAPDAVDHAISARNEDRIDAVAHGAFGLAPAVGDVVAELVGDVGAAAAELLFDDAPKRIERSADARFRVHQYPHLAGRIRWTDGFHPARTYHGHGKIATLRRARAARPRTGENSRRPRGRLPEGTAANYCARAAAS